MDGQTDEWTDLRTDGWTDGRTDGWMDGRTDGLIDGRIEFPPCVLQDFVPFGAAALLPLTPIHNLVEFFYEKCIWPPSENY